ncbi:KAP family P-loop domain [Phocoenobacter uteri]|uniref:KAP family P-loop domain n=1 Tax=Phocoenobacter uteri TaxID=146806 RepID=A0A379C9N7_9PAST|nr:P-loop NTPase fold protein [Phocoenobacter uteri]MDG6882671.1 hypothetical protein [Phocoenobacter uteri]SUB58838.1 KAP family P-loop domain [Phocoenobacter uteri]
MGHRQEKINVNQHIIDYLDYYLDSQSVYKSNYAVLLRGDWGCGKTYFIDKFIEEKKKNSKWNFCFLSKQNKYKFIKVSLFGLKNTNSITEKIFQILYPIRASRCTKFIKYTLNKHLKIDLDLILKGSINLNFIDDYQSKNKVKIIFIFDDLERTDIDIKEILGYINYFVEQNNFKIILLANEYKLLPNKENDNSQNQLYLEFKEKVIGKTFEVKHSFEMILEGFLEHHKIDLNEELNLFDIIKEVYESSGYKNLRYIDQSISEFKYVFNRIDSKYKQNIEFLSQFAKVFFVILIELKNGNLTEDTLNPLKDTNHTLKGDESKENKLSSLFKKYNLSVSDILFDIGDWEIILVKGDISQINNMIQGLHFFIEEEQQSWVKLWHFRELEDDEFDIQLNDMIKKFKNNQYLDIKTLLHVTALLVFFNNQKINSYALEDIKNQMLSNLENCYSDGQEGVLIEDTFWGAYGLGYYDKTSLEFQNMFEVFKEQNKIYYDHAVNQKKRDDLKNIISNLSKGNIKEISDFLNGDGLYIPIFVEKDCAKEFVGTVISVRNQKMFDFLYNIFFSRYSNRRNFKDYFSQELDFWKEVQKELSNQPVDLRDRKVKQFNLNLFKEKVTEIVDKMQNHNQ